MNDKIDAFKDKLKEYITVDSDKKERKNKRERKKAIAKSLSDEDENISKNYWKDFFQDILTKAIFIFIMMFIGSNFIWLTNMSEKPAYSNKFSLDKLFPSDLNKDSGCSNNKDKLLENPDLQPCENDFYANITSGSGDSKYTPGRYSCKKKPKKCKTNCNTVENGLDGIMMGDGGFPYNFLTQDTYRDLNRDESFVGKNANYWFNKFFIDVDDNYINAKYKLFMSWSPGDMIPPAAQNFPPMAGFKVGINLFYLLVFKIWIALIYYIVLCLVLLFCCLINWQGGLNWLISAVGQSYSWQRAIIKAILKLHIPTPSIAGNTKLLAKEPVRMFAAIFYLGISLMFAPIISIVINSISLFWRSKSWAFISFITGFLFMFPGFLAGIQFIQLMATFFIVPLLLDSKGVGDILLCNRNVFIILYGLFIVLAGMKYLKPVISLSMTLIYLLFIIKIIYNHFKN